MIDRPAYSKTNGGQHETQAKQNKRKKYPRNTKTMTLFLASCAPRWPFLFLTWSQALKRNQRPQPDKAALRSKDRNSKVNLAVSH